MKKIKQMIAAAVKSRAARVAAVGTVIAAGVTTSSSAQVTLTNVYDIPAAFATVNTYCLSGSGLAATFILVGLGLTALGIWGRKAIAARRG